MDAEICWALLQSQLQNLIGDNPVAASTWKSNPRRSAFTFIDCVREDVGLDQVVQMALWVRDVWRRLVGASIVRTQWTI